MKFELRLMTAGALLLLLIAASCQQQAIASPARHGDLGSQVAHLGVEAVDALEQ
jgi:hypothetical protein